MTKGSLAADAGFYNRRGWYKGGLPVHVEEESVSACSVYFGRHFCYKWQAQTTSNDKNGAGGTPKSKNSEIWPKSCICIRSAHNMCLSWVCHEEGSSVDFDTCTCFSFRSVQASLPEETTARSCSAWECFHTKIDLSNSSNDADHGNDHDMLLRLGDRKDLLSALLFNGSSSVEEDFKSQGMQEWWSQKAVQFASSTASLLDDDEEMKEEPSAFVDGTVQLQDFFNDELESTRQKYPGKIQTCEYFCEAYLETPVIQWSQNVLSTNDDGNETLIKLSSSSSATTSGGGDSTSSFQLHRSDDNKQQSISISKNFNTTKNSKSDKNQHSPSPQLEREMLMSYPCMKWEGKCTGIKVAEHMDCQCAGPQFDNAGQSFPRCAVWSCSHSKMSTCSSQGMCIQPVKSAMSGGIAGSFFLTPFLYYLVLLDYCWCRKKKRATLIRKTSMIGDCATEKPTTLNDGGVKEEHSSISQATILHKKALTQSRLEDCDHVGRPSVTVSIGGGEKSKGCSTIAVSFISLSLLMWTLIICTAVITGGIVAGIGAFFLSLGASPLWMWVWFQYRGAPNSPIMSL